MDLALSYASLDGGGGHREANVSGVGSHDYSHAQALAVPRDTCGCRRYVRRCVCACVLVVGNASMIDLLNVGKITVNLA